MEQRFIVQNNEAGERLDKWLCTKLAGTSRGKVKALLDGGMVRINGRRVVIAGWKIEDGDDVEVGASPKSVARRASSKRKSNLGGEERSTEKPGRLNIYYEDRDIIVVEKPAGVLAVPHTSGDRNRDTLISEIHGYMRRKHRGSKNSFIAPLHRLDVETSGVMVFALSRVGQSLDNQFRTHSIRREYVAVVSGRLGENRGVINMPLEKGEFGGGKKVKRAKTGEGKEAITEFYVKERYTNATLVDIRMRTGRTHQIRVHLAEKGFPLVGDKLYAEGRSSNAPEFHRHALHAKLLGFAHPATGEKMLFQSKLPDDMKELIDSLRQV